MRKSPRRRPMAEINVVPYIDVSLVLLIIFMITAPLLQTGVDVQLPRAEAKTVAQTDTPPVIVSIDATGQCFLDIGDHEDHAVEVNELTSRVAEILQDQPGTAVLIRGDAEVDYGKVVTVMAALQQAGVPNIGLMTRPLDQ
ncbi:MAG: protein TolR [Methylococcales bacterium]